MRTLLLTLLLTGCVAVHAQERRWTLEECIAYAYEHNIEIKTQELSTEEKRIALSESRWGYAPDISVSNSYSLSTGRVLDPTTYEWRARAATCGSTSRPPIWRCCAPRRRSAMPGRWSPS